MQTRMNLKDDFSSLVSGTSVKLKVTRCDHFSNEIIKAQLLKDYNGLLGGGGGGGGYIISVLVQVCEIV